MNLGSGNGRSVAYAAHVGGVAAAGVFGSILLVAYLIISGNSEEITSPKLYAIYFLAASVVITALLLLVFWVLPRGLGKLIAVVIAAYALIALVFDAVLPLGIGELETGTESALSAPVWASFVQLAGTIGLAAIIWRLPLPLMGRLGWTLAAMVVASTAISLIIIPSAATPNQTAAAAPREDAPPYNIYHVVFDSYYGPWLGWAIKELDMEPATFAGFTHYESMRTNYWRTIYSYPSFMTGTMYEPTMTIKEWVERSEGDSLVTDLKELGYKNSYLGLTAYPLGANMFVGADLQTEGTELGGSGLPGLARWGGGNFLTVLDLWALRAAPVAFRHVLFQDGGGPLGRRFAPKVSVEASGEIRASGDIRTYRSFQQFLRFLDAEAQRAPSGEYINFHVYPPHGPHELDRRGSYVGKSSYDEQMLLATNMMSMLLERLKELGKFDNAFIILQSDHGRVLAGREKYRGDTERDFVTIGDLTADRITRMNLRGVEGREIDARFGALLLVKPPATCGTEADGETLRVDRSLTQLKDIREFVVAVVSGRSPSCAFPSRDFVDIQVGMSQLDGKGNLVKIKELDSGELNVFRIHKDGVWEILPNISFSFR